MLALLRLLIFVLAIEVIFYLLLSIYLRSTRREALENEWDEENPGRAGPSEERSEFVRRSMIGYSKTLRARLAALVLVLPLVLIIFIVILVNAQ